MKPTTDKIIKRFFKYVDKQDYHWIWTGAKSGNQGRIKINGVPVRVMKLSYVYHFGPLPEYVDLFRKCGNSSCVRPEHIGIRTGSTHLLTKGKNDFEAYTPEWYERNREIHEQFENPKVNPSDFELCDLLHFKKTELHKNYYGKKLPCAESS